MVKKYKRLIGSRGTLPDENYRKIIYDFDHILFRFLKKYVMVVKTIAEYDLLDYEKDIVYLIIDADNIVRIYLNGVLMFDELGIELFDVTFTVTAGVTPVENAKIVIDGEEKFTNALGVAVFQLIADTFTYEITHPSYTTITGTVVVTGVQSVNEDIATTDIDVTTYITGLVTPLSEGQITLLNNFVTSLKTGLGITNLSDAFDVMYIFANETSEAGLRNLVKRSHDATLSATAPSFTALEGFTGNVALIAYIDTNYNAVTQGVNYTLNDASVGVYQRLLKTSGGRFIFGAVVGSGYTVFSESGANTRLHNLTANSVTSVLGMNILSRSEAASWNFHGNKNAAVNVVRASTAMPDCREFLLTYSNNNNPSSVGDSSDTQLSFYFKSKAVTQANVNVIYDTFQAYMTANGKQV